MWREMIAVLEADTTFFPAATTEQIQEVEQALGIALPNSLKMLLLETDGVYGPYELGLIWSVERIRKHNLDMRISETYRKSYMPFHAPLFFAEAGNGDLFAFPLVEHEIRASNVFVWSHENDSRTWVAPSLEKYLEWWLDGTMKI